MAARFTHLALPCRNLDATIAWYEAHTPMRAFHRRTNVDAEVAWLAEVVPGVDSSVGLVMVQTFEARACRAWLNVLTGLPLADRPCAMPMSSGLWTALVGEIRRLYVPCGPEPVSRG